MSFSATRRRNCYERDGWKCVKCGSTENLTLDHVIPRVLGGKDWLKNLQTLCKPCNQAKGPKIAQYTKHRGTRELVAKYKQAAQP